MIYYLDIHIEMFIYLKTYTIPELQPKSVSYRGQSMCVLWWGQDSPCVYGGEDRTGLGWSQSHRGAEEPLSSLLHFKLVICLEIWEKISIELYITIRSLQELFAIFKRLARNLFVITIRFYKKKFHIIMYLWTTHHIWYISHIPLSTINPDSEGS